MAQGSGLSVRVGCWVAKGMALITAVAVLCGCTVGPSFTPPKLASPATFGSEPPDVPSRTYGGDTDATWWRAFHDPELNALIGRLVSQNLQLRAAAERIEQARAQTRIVAAQGLPNLDAGATYTRMRQSPNGFISLVQPAPGAPLDYNQYQTTLSASWEVDLFGKVRRAVEAARANTDAVEEARHALALDSLAELAQDYFQLRQAQALEAVLRRDVALSQTRGRLVRDRFRNGVATTLDVAQADAVVSTTRQDLPGLLAQEAAFANAIGLLLAMPPRALDAELAPSAIGQPGVPSLVPVGLPADLVRRRPDIREAEARLHIATAEGGVAVANFYPDVSFTGSFGFDSLHSSTLFDWASRTFRLTPSVDLPIFKGGQLRGTLQLRNSQQREAALNFHQTVLQAWREVDDALTGYARTEQSLAETQATLAADRRSLTAAQQQYEQGASNYLNVVSAQTAVIQGETAVTRANGSVETQLVDVYKALGGGWQVADPSAAKP